ncbi:hypothetical protein V1509DRAFT_620482 [Lipomyces kononenkoae]
MSAPHSRSMSGSTSATGATTPSTSSRTSLEYSSSSPQQQQQQQGSTTLHRDFRARQQRRPISVAMSSSEYPVDGPFSGSSQQPSSGSGSGFHYSSAGGSYSSIDLDSRYYQKTNATRRDSGDSAETSSVVGKKGTGGSSFMGGLFHLGRKPKNKDDGSVSPAKATPGKIISGSGGTVVYTGNNFSDTHLINGGARHHGTHLEPTAGLQQKPPLKPTQPERTVRKQSSGLILPTVGPVTASTAQTVHPKLNSTPPKQLDKGMSMLSVSPTSVTTAAATKKVLVLCTMDHEHYVVINVSGLTTSELVRRAVSEKLHLDGAMVYLYITELGEFESGEPLSDEELIETCLRGDSKCTLKFFVRVVGRHYQSAPDIMYQGTALPTHQAAAPKPSSIYQQQVPMRRRQNSPSGLIQPNLRVNTSHVDRDTIYPPAVTQSIGHRHSNVGLKDNKPEPDSESKFKVIKRPTPLIDFDQGRKSPYGINAPREREFTAMRNPPPPPQGRQGAVSTASASEQLTVAGQDNNSLQATIQPRSVSLDASAQANLAVSPMTVLQGGSVGSAVANYRSQQIQHQIEPQLAWNTTYAQPEKSFSVPRKSLGSSQAHPRTSADRDPVAKISPEKKSTPPTPPTPPPPVPPKGDEAISHAKSENISYKTVTMEAFQENDISFADAPAFPTFDDGNSSDGDDGLWAKKPPSASTAKDAEPAIAGSLVSNTDSVGVSNTESTSRQNSGKSNRPVLKVQIGHTEIIGSNGNPMSAITERSESAKESATTPSPTSTVDELNNKSHYRQSGLGQQTPASSSAGISADVWAVRPPAEVVYDNLEKFFPNTDLDKPIIDDTPLYSPNSPAVDASGSPTSQDPPVGIPSVAPTDTNANMSTNDATLQPANDKNLDRGFSFKLTSHGGVPDEEKLDVQPKCTTAAAAAAAVAAAGTTDLTTQQHGTTVQRPITRGSRMKSIRIVAREASEARKNLNKSSQSKSGGNGAALLRRKSTKMWGQRVVEVTPGQIKKGQLSVRRQGQAQQFNWVKGELIGKGTFGRVYLALNATTGEMIAVKQVDVPQTASDKDSVKQREVVEALNAEVETMKDLDHLNIVQYLGYEALPDVCSLFLEYVPGGSIGTCLRKHGRFERPVIHSLTRQVVDGLAYLHSKGILHRDLKSDNLLLDLDGICKISDFGISKRSQNIYSNDAEMSMQGTIFWMAPEVIHNVVHNEKQGYSAKVDIWSLGCVLLEMFAGRRPWSNDEAIGAMYKLGNAKLAPPIPEDTVDYVCEDGKEFLASCFMVDPEKRPTAQVLLDTKFCALDPDFKFADTNLAKLIKFNDKRKEQTSFQK